MQTYAAQGTARGIGLLISSSENTPSPYSATSTPGIEPVMRRWLALEQLHYALPETFVLPSHVALVGRLCQGPNSLGRSRQEAPLTKTHRIASTTVRCSRHCPPRRPFSGRSGLRRAHCSSATFALPRWRVLVVLTTRTDEGLPFFSEVFSRRRSARFAIWQRLATAW